jgi:hypothetical protein
LIRTVEIADLTTNILKIAPKIIPKIATQFRKNEGKRQTAPSGSGLTMAAVIHSRLL